MTNCIFCKIIKKEADSFKLYEDDYVISFLDINPASEGHLLVVPKEHFQDAFSTPDEILGHINIVCKKMGELCKSKLGATGINILNAAGKDAQQSVFHTHFHVVPRFENDGIDLWFPENPVKSQLERTLDKLMS